MKNYIVTPTESHHYTSEVFRLIQKGAFKINVHKEYAFTVEGVVDAQRDLTSGKTTGKLVIKIATA
jgi:NADPH:quinone reductase